MKKIKVVHVLKCMDMGGIETLIMNVFKNIDRTNVEFIFILFDENRSFYEDEIEKLGGRIYHIGKEKNPLKQMKNIRKVLKKEKPDVVHSHTLFYSGIVLLAAKLEKVNIRISHSHSKSDNKKNNFKRRMFRIIASWLIRVVANAYLACSIEAAEYLYGKKYVNKNKVIIIKNGIEPEKYLEIDDKKIRRIKEQYNINEKDYVITMIARLAKEKNHLYALKIAKQLKNENAKFKIFFVGDGILKEQIEKDIIKYDLNENVFLTGVTTEPQNFLEIADVFILPSKFEGFGITILEAQTNKKICLVSKNIPKDADLDLGLVKYLDINDENINEWVKEIKKSRDYKKYTDDIIKDKLIEKGLDITETVKN